MKHMLEESYIRFNADYSSTFWVVDQAWFYTSLHFTSLHLSSSVLIKNLLAFWFYLL